MALFRADTAKAASTFRLARRFWPYLSPLRHWIAASVVLSLVLPPVGGALLLLIKAFVDNIVEDHRFNLLPMLAVGFIFTATAKVSIDFVAGWLEAWIAETIIYRLRTDLYRHVLTLSPGSLGQHSIGDILARLETDVERAEVLLYTAPGLIVADCVATVFLLWYYFLSAGTLAWRPWSCCRRLPWWLCATLHEYAAPRG